MRPSSRRQRSERAGCEKYCLGSVGRFRGNRGRIEPERGERRYPTARAEEANNAFIGPPPPRIADLLREVLGVPEAIVVS